MPTEAARASKTCAATAAGGVRCSRRADSASRAASRNRASASERFTAQNLRTFPSIVPAGSGLPLRPSSRRHSYPDDAGIPTTLVSRRRWYPDDARIPAALVSRRHSYPGGTRILTALAAVHASMPVPALGGHLPDSTFDRMPIHQFRQTGIVILDRQHFSIMPNMFRSHSSLSRRTRGFDADPQGMWRLTRGHVRPIVCLRHGKQALAQHSGHVMPPRLELERQRGERLRANPLAGASLDEGDACSSTR